MFMIIYTMVFYLTFVNAYEHLQNKCNIYLDFTNA